MTTTGHKTTVLFLIDVLQELGGSEKNLREVANGLNKNKYNVIICCLKAGKVYEEFKESGFRVIDLNLKRIYSWAAIKKSKELIKLIKNNQVKIMVTCFESSDFLGSVIGKISGVPVLISSRRDMGFALKRRYLWAYRIINHLFDKIITVSNAVKNNIILNENVSPDKIQTIYNGVDIFNYVVINKEELKLSLGLDLNKFTVTMLANLSPVKNHKDFLIAAAKVIEKYKEVQFLLVGKNKNDYENELSSFAQKLGIKNNVIFTGFRPDADQILSISDVSVLSSTSEGFSNAILESMAASKPVVATDVGGNPEAVINGKTGFLVPPKDSAALADAILRLLENKELRNEMGVSGRKRIETLFSLKKMKQDIENLYDTTLAGKYNGGQA